MRKPRHYLKPIPHLADADVSRFVRNLRSADSGCVEWTSSIDGGGYGRLRLRSGYFQAHRIAMHLAGIDVSNGFGCHTCDNRKCVSPAHLYLGSNVSNITDMWERKRRPNRLSHRLAYCRDTNCTHPDHGDAKASQSAQANLAQACRNGHLLEGANLYVSPRGSRSCRTCQAAAGAKYRAKNNLQQESVL